MKKLVLVAVASVALMSGVACVGKAPGYGFGKGKAPPPAPVSEPIVRKG
jgi:hypothetical protein